MKIMYKITYPNGRSCVGKGLTDSINYFGSADHALIASDFDREKRHDFTIRSQIGNRHGIRMNQMEAKFIKELRSHDPAVCYNRRPKSRSS